MSDARPKTSCEPCRKRKTKCDSAHVVPCSSCKLRRTEARCTAALPVEPVRPAHTPTAAVIAHRRVSLPESQSRSASEIENLKASVRRLEAHIVALEDQLVVSVTEAGSEERRNWDKLLSVLPSKPVVEVLLEYLLQECDSLWQCRDIVSLWRHTIARSGVSSAHAGLLCMSICVPALFLGPYQAPYYPLPIDASKLHGTLFDTARTFLTGARSLDELELLQVLLTYAVWTGRHDLVVEYTGKTMDIAVRDGWLDENSWQDLTVEDRTRARLVLSEIVASYKWSLLMMGPDLLGDVRINICRPTAATQSLQAPIILDLPDASDLPLRLFRMRSRDEAEMGTVYRGLIRDFTELIPGVRRLMLDLPPISAYGTNEWTTAVDRSYRLQQEMREWREVKLPTAGLIVEPVDPNSPLSCHKAARSVLLYHAIGCVEGIITRHWLTMGKFGSVRQQQLHDECLYNAQRGFDTIPTVRALLNTRHAPFVSTFIVCGLFNAATCFAVPLLRAAGTGESITSLPAWPEKVMPGPISTVQTAAAFNNNEIRQYANNILVVLDMLVALNALPCGKMAQDRLEALIQQFGLSGSVDTQHADDTLWMGMPELMDPYPGMWDELLQLDPGVWEGFLGVDKGTGNGVGAFNV